MPKKPGFIALDVLLEFMQAVHQLANHTHQKRSILLFPNCMLCKLDNFNVEHTCILPVLSMKIVIVIYILCYSDVMEGGGRGVET